MSWWCLSHEDNISCLLVVGVLSDLHEAKESPQYPDSSDDCSGSSVHGVDGGVWLSWKEISCCFLLIKSPWDLFFAFLKFLWAGLGETGVKAGFKGVARGGVKAQLLEEVDTPKSLI